MAKQDTPQILQSKSLSVCRSPYRCGSQSFQPLPHLYVQQRDHARQERTGRNRRCRQADQQRAGPRLHHQLELRHRRNMDTARPQFQRRLLLRPPQPKRNRHGESQPGVQQPVQLVPAVLRRPALDSRTCLCRLIRVVPFRSGLLHRERPSEMGIAGSNFLLDCSGMGQELHATDGFLHRLYPDV